MDNSDGRHLQFSNSRLKFPVFAMSNQAQGVSNVMTCEVQLCALNAGNCNVARICPTTPADYQYTLTGN